MPRFPLRSLLRSGAALLSLATLAGCAGDTKPAGGSASAVAPASGTEATLLVGSYTEGPMSSGKSKGIATFRFDTVTGEARPLAHNDGIRNPSWLVLSQDTKFVYAVNELNGTGKSGEVSAFAYDAASGRLTFLNKVSSEGDDPCHLMLRNSRNIVVSNYSAGGYSVLGLDKTGRLTPALRTVTPTDDTDAGRISHLHSTTLRPGGTYFFAADLGLDRVTMDTEIEGRASDPRQIPSVVPMKPGAGPRHMIFDNKGDTAYIINETNDTVTLRGEETLSRIRGGKAPFPDVPLGVPVTPGKGTAAAIHLSEDGRFLYASVRNPKNIIVVFAVNPTDGSLREIQTVSSGGKAPREFTIAPGGKFLLVANQQSDAIAVFSRDPETGKITDTGRRIETGTPVDLKWAPAW